MLLLDEPLTALDAKLKESLRDELAELLRRLGITAIHVTHDQQEALAIADRLAVMRQGRIVQVGPGEELYRDPRHPFVAEFLGRINRLERDAQARARGVVRFGGIDLPCPDALRGQDALLVRPEDIALTDVQPGLATGRVQQRVFLGDRVQLRIAVEEQGTLLVDAGRDAAYRAGDTVGLRLQPERLLPSRENEA